MARKIPNLYTQNPHRYAGHELWHSALNLAHSSRKAELKHTQPVKIIGTNEISVEKVIHTKGGGAHALITRIDSKAPPKKWQTEAGSITFVYYPNPQHMEAFRKGSSGLKWGAPGKKYLGSVGSLKIAITTMDNQKVYQVHYIQGHSKSGVRHSPPRALTTKYGGWRQKLLEAAFAQAEKNQLPILLAEPNLRSQPNKTPSVENRIKIFKETAEKCGFKVSEKDPGLWPVVYYIAKR